ncbi:hypothetical protein ABID21_001396 [Pseudorhizobium tarimense]|uniref:SHOCT domain-containing protein n=1 Tax=Pseudorhizobium tarimense TaxID=1079109 RepID=A0ABV2H4C9_9HYPH|nr:hypothetical protein [Pseudorhizobium tarimense]MCJ8518295.1 hypothetical protein [Pseudorhizobium tarimense]
MPANDAARVDFLNAENWADAMEELRRRAASLPLFLCVGTLPILLAGCNSFALDDGIPNTAPQAIVVSGQGAPEGRPLAKRNTGTYPTFGPQLTAANTQIADEQAAGTEAQLSALAQARANGHVSEAEYQQRLAELRRLAAQHAAEAEAAIAN